MISYLVASSPLVIGLFSLYRYRRCGNPSGRLIGLLCVASAGSMYVLCTWPGLEMEYSALLLSGSIVCCAIGLSFWIRRYRVVSIVLVAVGIFIVELAILAWIDVRFRVVVMDRDGMPVKAGDIALHHPPESYFQAYRQVDGIRIGKGTIYFGILRWLEYKERWTFSGRFGGPDGHYLGDLKWEHAKWSEWPKYVTVNNTDGNQP